MPLIQTLFYFAGFISFILAAILMIVTLVMILGSYKRLGKFADTVEEKMNQSIVSILMPFLPAIIALFGELKRSHKKN
ncbi:hypothetical protein A3B57_03100 [Microgenomates group bacterium RIFCSPLOWO2_01_FULL_47_10]|nr:MAG: hypothetical protein A3B57_03100 [Microgenomates group bacterium RIFCSPLOWO2_01_FULL_47_10]